MSYKTNELLNPKIRKWNFETREYEAHEPGENAKIILYTPDMKTELSCTSCEKMVILGDCYTSRQYHNPVGLGFPVCGSCYNAESKLEQEYES